MRWTPRLDLVAQAERARFVAARREHATLGIDDVVARAGSGVRHPACRAERQLGRQRHDVRVPEPELPAVVLAPAHEREIGEERHRHLVARCDRLYVLEGLSVARVLHLQRRAAVGLAARGEPSVVRVAERPQRAVGLDGERVVPAGVDGDHAGQRRELDRSRALVRRRAEVAAPDPDGAGDPADHGRHVIAAGGDRVHVREVRPRGPASCGRRSIRRQAGRRDCGPTCRRCGYRAARR